jgi:hypothetical protein
MNDPLYQILNQYSYELKKNKTTRTKQVLFIKAKDKARTQKEIESQLTKKKFVFYRKKDNALSGSTEVTVIDYSNTVKGMSVVLVFKPASGGMQETTLNSTITELSPALAFNERYNPKNYQDFYDFLKVVNHNRASAYLVSRDRESGKNFIDTFPNSSKFKEKMENAIGVLKFLQQENKTNPIANVYWGYRAKPAGVDAKHKGDLFLEYKSGSMTGVSLKAGEEKSKEPKLNTYVNRVLEQLSPSMVNTLRDALYKRIYSNFSDKEKSYDKGIDKKETLVKLDSLEKNDLKGYNSLYDTGLNMIRTALIETFESNTKNTLDYLRSAIVGEDSKVPLLVIKAYGTNFKILTDEDDVAVFLSKTKDIKAYGSSTSKQDFYIELIASPTDKLKLKFAVRTNKAGSEHKLGQFYNLAVKFNGVE